MELDCPSEAPSAGAGNAEAAARQRSHARARRNWRRAKYAVTRKITQDMLGVQRRLARLSSMALVAMPKAHWMR
jgi:hypothetical protein